MSAMRVGNRLERSSQWCVIFGLLPIMAVLALEAVELLGDIRGDSWSLLPDAWSLRTIRGSLVWVLVWIAASYAATHDEPQRTWRIWKRLLGGRPVVTLAALGLLPAALVGAWQALVVLAAVVSVHDLGNLLLPDAVGIPLAVTTGAWVAAWACFFGSRAMLRTRRGG